MTRLLVTAGGYPQAAGWRARLDDMTESDGPEAEARRLAQVVTCAACGGQATATRGVVWINHAPRCSRFRRRQDA